MAAGGVKLVELSDGAGSPAQQQPSLLELYGKPINEIGQGGYGTVYITDKGYAVKITKREIDYGDLDDGENEGVKEIIPPELNSMVYPMCLNHPSIIKYYNIYIGTDDISLVMKIYEGDILHLQEKQSDVFVDMNTFKSLAFQMVTAVAYLTANGILHGDIKPQNILYRSCPTSPLRYKFVLTDFDLTHGRICQEKRRRLENLYTLYYRPPEILVRYPYFTDKSDVWALGVTLADMFINSVLFFGYNDDDIKNAIHHRIAPEGGEITAKWLDTPSPQLPFVDDPKVEKFLRKMLKIEPTERASIFELQHDKFLSAVSSLSDKCVTTRITNSNTCFKRINNFDRHIDYTPLLQRAAAQQKWQIVTEWMANLRQLTTHSVETAIVSVELVARYLLIHPDQPDSRLQLISCGALYIAATFHDYPIPSEVFSYSSDRAYTVEEIPEMVIEILTVLNFDLCAKTGYDEIYRHRDMLSDEVLNTAAELLQLAYTQLDLFILSITPKMTLHLSMLFHTGSPYSLKFDDATVAMWKNKFLEYFGNYDQPIMSLLKDVNKVMNSWKN